MNWVSTDHIVLICWVYVTQTKKISDCKLWLAYIFCSASSRVYHNIIGPCGLRRTASLHTWQPCPACNVRTTLFPVSCSLSSLDTGMIRHHSTDPRVSSKPAGLRNWTCNIDDYRQQFESNKQWSARRQFILKHVAEYEENALDKLLALSMVWVNHVFLGCRWGFYWTYRENWAVWLFSHMSLSAYLV